MFYSRRKKCPLSVCPECLFSIELVKDVDNSDRWGPCLEGSYRCRETQAWLQPGRARGQQGGVQGAFFQEERMNMCQSLKDARNQRWGEL